MMEINEAIKERRSIRSFIKGRKLTREELTNILEMGICAPSGGNIQPWYFYVVLEETTKHLLAEAAYNQMFIEDASAVIVVCMDEKLAYQTYGHRGVSLYCIQDTAAAIQNILLTACSMKLGGCWVGAFDADKIVKVIGIDETQRPVALIPIGYPAEIPEKTKRKSLSQVTKWIG